ncbi:MAG: peptidylprolyl isomerase [Pseudanabaenaceae cyanobacterium]
MLQMVNKLLQTLACTLILGVLLWGCTTTAATTTASIPQSTPPAMIYPNLPRLNGTATVEMNLASGKVVMELDGKSAPITAGNFVDLVQRGFYNGLTFHRVVKQPNPFVVQGGDPLGNGMGGFTDPKTRMPRTIPLEIQPEGQSTPIYGKTLAATQAPKLRHNRGAVAMARTQNPDSASSQFYIALDNIYFLDGSYAVFGYVKSGMDLVDKIQQGDRIISMKVIQGAENLQVPQK